MANLGFSGGSSRSRRSRMYDDYDDFGAEGEDYSEFAEYGPGYDPNKPLEQSIDYSRYEPYNSVSTRPASAYSRPISPSYGGRSASTSTPRSTAPRLVTMDDVRAHTKRSSSVQSAISPASARISAYRGARMTVDASMPIPADPAAEANASIAAARGRSEAFEARNAPAAPAFGASSRSSMMPGLREVKVVKPISFAEAEKVSKALKAGSAVVLVLRAAPDSISKRILDFSFGAASVLGASVDCIADKVFVLTTGSQLSESELAQLRSQGVI